MNSKNLSCESLALKNCFFDHSVFDLPGPWLTEATCQWINQLLEPHGLQWSRELHRHIAGEDFLVGRFPGVKRTKWVPWCGIQVQRISMILFICFCYLLVCFFSCHVVFLLSFCWPGARYYDLHVFLQEVHSSMTKAQLQRRYCEILPSPMLRAFGGDGNPSEE